MSSCALDSLAQSERLLQFHMLAITNPNLMVGGYALGGIVLYLFWRLVVWVRDSPTHPDPWEAEVALKLADPETPQVCPHCSTPQPATAWFCEYCGRAVGPYNNLMPYVNIFSEGEVLRCGTGDRLRKGFLIPIGYLLISVNFLVAGIVLAPKSLLFSLFIFVALISYWVLIFKNLKRQAEAEPKLQESVLK